VLAFINWRFVVVFFAAKYVALLLTTLGFFQEHGMVDVTQPQNVYRNSIHYLAPDNAHGSLGDDIHIEHHIHPGRYWGAYVADATNHADRYAAEDALTFLDGPGHLRRYYQLLWRRDFVQLAALFVVFGRPAMSLDERAELLRARTRPWHARHRSIAQERLDTVVGRVLGHVVPEI
jgi:hypothetical protein